jgi:Ca2+-transporting ATPase
MLVLSLMKVFFSFITVIFVFKIALFLNLPEAEARTLTFITLIISNICLILTNRSWTKTILTGFSLNRALVSVIIGAVIFLFIVLYVPPLQKLFHFEKMHLIDLFVCFCAGILSVIWFEILKYIFNKLKLDIMK